MINYIKNLPGTSSIRKIILTIIGITFGVIGCGFGILACIAGCSANGEILFYIWEISVILIVVNLIILGYKKSKRLNISLITIILFFIFILYIFEAHS